jgi:hypothetical protein
VAAALLRVVPDSNRRMILSIRHGQAHRDLDRPECRSRARAYHRERGVKQRIRPMLGFKRFDNAVVTISEIELAEKIRKGQFKTGKLGGCNATMTELWHATLAS